MASGTYKLFGTHDIISAILATLLDYTTTYTAQFEYKLLQCICDKRITIAAMIQPTNLSQINNLLPRKTTELFVFIQPWIITKANQCCRTYVNTVQSRENVVYETDFDVVRNQVNEFGIFIILATTNIFSFCFSC